MNALHMTILYVVDQSVCTPCLKKQPKLFSSELRQISINFDNFWHKDGQDNKIV